MKPLLDDKFSPTTNTIGFLESPLATVAEAMLGWQKSLFTDVELTTVDAPLAVALQRLAPLATPARKLLLLQTCSPWVACFDNGRQGSDPAGLVGHLCTLLKCRGLVASWRPGRRGSDAEGLALGFRLYAAEPRAWLNIERSISLVNDYGEWDFEQSGDVQAYEQAERYVAEAVRDRFDAGMLVAYCAELGIALTDADFYGPAARLLQRGDVLPTEALSESMKNARRQLGLPD